MRPLLAVLAASMLVACSGIRQLTMPDPSPELGYRFLELILDEGFESGVFWTQYADGNQLFMGVREGAYHIEFGERKYVWSQHEEPQTDIVIEADLAQTSDYDHNAFGLACRLDMSNRGRGYFFLIGGDGYASIRWSDGRTLEPIVAATPSGFVRQGRSSNRLRVVCVEDYLALWVNGHFVADARDGRASAGAVGLVGVMNYPGRPFAVQFDDLKLWRAALESSDR